MGGRPHAERVRVGQIRRHEALGSVSVYRVIAIDPPVAVMEVIEAPGLPTGATVRLMLRNVERMRVISADSASRPGPIADAA